MTGYQTKDSGMREDFETGSRRDTRQGKGRYDLLSPHFLRRLAGVMERGAEKYGDRNWELGQPMCRTWDSAVRHLIQWMLGETDEDHLGQAGFNIQALIHFEEEIRAGRLSPSLDDRPAWKPWGKALPEVKPLFRTDEFINWLEKGPVSVQDTYEHFRDLGWSDDEIHEISLALRLAGKVDYYFRPNCGLACYILTSQGGANDTCD